MPGAEGITADTEHDPICALIYSVFHDIPQAEGERYTTGVILVDQASASQSQAKGHSGTQTSQSLLHQAGLPSVRVTYISRRALVREGDYEMMPVCACVRLCVR